MIDKCALCGDAFQKREYYLRVELDKMGFTSSAGIRANRCRVHVHCMEKLIERNKEESIQGGYLPDTEGDIEREP